MAGEDEVRIDASLHDDISEAVGRIENRMESLEHAAERLGRAGAKGGAEFAAGMDEVGESADEAGDQARQAKKPVKDLGDEAAKTGTKATVGGKGLDSFGRSADRAGKKAKFFQTTLMLFKFAGIATGLLAIAGGLSAIGAGAVIAVGGLAPMVGVVAGALPIFAAAKLSMLAWKLSAEAMEPTLTRIKNQFSELGTQIANGGLRSGLDYFANRLDGLAKVTGKGLASLGKQLGLAARKAGDLAASAPFLAQVQRVFQGLEPIVGNVTEGLLNLARAILNVIEGAMPMAQMMAADFAAITHSLADWTAAQLANGRMADWLVKSYSIFKRTIGVLVDILIGLFNIFRIGAGYAGEMGTSIEETARQFRTWTGSAEGQARINQYFQDSLPALHEMGKLLGMIARGFGGLAANQNVAPLLNQIRTEFAPALGELVGKLSGQDGLGPALIDAATALARLLASMDFSALTLFVQAIAKVIEGVVWLTQNVPGASGVMSGLLGAFLAFKVIGSVWSVVEKGEKALKWVEVATTGTGKLTLAQKLFAKTMPILGKVFGAVGGAIVGVIRTIGAAMLANPVLLVIALIIAAIVFMWFKFAWFRDAVIAVWTAISGAVIAAWNAVVNAIVTAITWTRDLVVAVWNAISTAATTAWNAIVNVVKTVVDAVVSFVLFIWDHGVKQVLSVILTAFKVTFAIIAFVVQTVIYIIAAIIAFLAFIAEKVWNRIVAIAQWAWTNVIQPVFEAIKIAWNAVVGVLSAAWNWLWATVIAPVINAIQTAWNAFTTAMSIAWNAVVSALSIAWNAFYSATIGPVISAIQVAWNATTTAISNAWNATVGVLSGAWNGFKGIVGGVVNGIRKVWGDLTSWLASVFKPVGEAINSIWNGIQTAAQKVGGVIKGIWDGIVGVIKTVWNAIATVWNGIPSVTIPDWVPLVGGSTFGLPKMPKLWHGGEAPNGRALVGEHGPEPVVVNGTVTGMVGVNGPEIANLPSGGYVVPNLSTLSALPGLTKTLPHSVAAAVARSVPGYADALGAPSSGHDSGLAGSIDRLARSIDGQMPPVHVHGTGDTTRDVLDAWRAHRREEEAHGRYKYETAGR